MRRPCWGRRRAARASRRSGWQVDDKRIRCLWQGDGERKLTKKRKKRLTEIGVPAGAMCPIRSDALRALDSQFDTTSDGRSAKMLNVIDEVTCQCLAIDPHRSIDAVDVVTILDRVVPSRMVMPGFVKFNNGHGSAAHTIVDWCRFSYCESVGINPGSP
jgi:putative transposase